LCRWIIFYEWKKTANGKQPYAIALADQGIMALAGLWEMGEWVRAFAIVTTTPNECAELRNRMPVVLGSETWPCDSEHTPIIDSSLWDAVQTQRGMECCRFSPLASISSKAARMPASFSSRIISMI
jgi:hypothetical protein